MPKLEAVWSVSITRVAGLHPLIPSDLLKVSGHAQACCRAPCLSLIQVQSRPGDLHACLEMNGGTPDPPAASHSAACSLPAVGPRLLTTACTPARLLLAPFATTAACSKPQPVTAACACSQWTRTTFYRGGDDSYVMATYSRLLQRLRVILAGRAAEQVQPCPMLGGPKQVLALAALLMGS